MNRAPRLPVPQHDHYARLRYAVIHGGETEVIGPYRTTRERDRAVQSRLDPYPGSYQPSVRRYSLERVSRENPGT